MACPCTARGDSRSAKAVCSPRLTSHVVEAAPGIHIMPFVRTLHDLQEVCVCNCCSFCWAPAPRVPAS
eukprot:4147599-Amphidinium_carterae.1